MNRKQLLIALATATGVSVSGAAGATTMDTDAAIFESALAKGPVALQELLSQNPDSVLGNKALDEMIHLAAAGDDHGERGDHQSDRGFDRSENDRSDGSRRGTGNSNTPAC